MDDVDMGMTGVVEGWLGDAGYESRGRAARGAFMSELVASLDFFLSFPAEYCEICDLYHQGHDCV
jgi:hypothetical protein